MEDTNTKKCSGDCLMCSFQQRVYCAAQISRNNMDAIVEMRESIKELSQKIDRLGNTDSDVFNPINDVKPEEHAVVEQPQEFETAQSDSGAENRLSRE